MPVEIQADIEGLRRKLNASPTEFVKALEAGGRRVGKRYLAHFKRTRLSGDPGIRATKKGFLRKGFYGFKIRGAKEGADAIQLKMFLRPRIARWYEEGHTIQPKKGQFLALPLKVAQDARGRTKPEFRALVKGGRRKLGDKSERLFVLKTKEGLFLARPQFDKRLRVQILFKLVRRAVVKPVLQYYRTWRGWTPEAIKIFRNAASFALQAIVRRRERGGYGK